MNEYLPHDPDDGPDDDDRLHGIDYFKAMAESRATGKAIENPAPARKRRRLVKPRKYRRGAPKRRDPRITFNRFGGYVSVRCHLRLRQENIERLQHAADILFQRNGKGDLHYGAAASVLLEAFLANLSCLPREALAEAALLYLPKRGVMTVDEVFGTGKTEGEHS